MVDLLTSPFVEQLRAQRLASEGLTPAQVTDASPNRILIHVTGEGRTTVASLTPTMRTKHMKNTFIALAFCLITGAAFAHNTPSGSAAGGLAGSISSASSSAGGSVNGNGKASDSAFNQTEGSAGVQLSIGHKGVTVSTGAATSSSNTVKGSKSGNANGSASGSAGSQAGAVAVGGVASFGNFGW